MRSLTNARDGASLRVHFERAARVLAFVALLAAWWLTGRPSASNAAANNEAVNTTDPARIAELVADPSRTSLHVNLRDVPNATSRAVLHAAREAGLSVAWRANEASPSLAPLAVSVSPLADPRGGMTVRVSAPDGSALSLADSLGWLDSAVVANGGVAWPLDGSTRELTVTNGATVARAKPLAISPVKRVRLFAAPGWEARFTMRALEDAGWSVDALFSIAPRVGVTAGEPSAPDTSRYAVVVALDSTAWPSAAAISTFVRNGGGLVLFPGAASGGALAGVRVGAVGAPSAGIPSSLALAAPREGLLMRPIAALHRDAVVLERSARPGNPVVMAARRVGSGRVLQVGWENSWEWRMLGGDEAVAQHRDWWRELLHRSARVSLVSGTEPWPLPGDAAPYADLVVRLGAPSNVLAGSEAFTMTPAPPSPWLFVVAALALLAEWWSRRLRGAP